MDISPTWGSLLFSLWIPRCVDKPIGLLSFILLQYINFGSPEPVSRPLALSEPVALLSNPLYNGSSNQRIPSETAANLQHSTSQQVNTPNPSCDSSYLLFSQS